MLIIFNIHKWPSKYLLCPSIYIICRRFNILTQTTCLLNDLKPLLHHVMLCYEIRGHEESMSRSRGEGVYESVMVCDRGREVKTRVMSHFKKIYHEPTHETWHWHFTFCCDQCNLYSERYHCGLHNSRVHNNSFVSQLKVINTGHGSSYINSSFIYAPVSCYVGDRWVKRVTLELAGSM